MTDLTVEPYSQLSYVVRGDKDKYHKAFHLIGGRWNQRLTNGGPGWIFASPKLDNQLLEFLNSCGDTYKFTSQKEVYGDNPDTPRPKRTKSCVKNIQKQVVNTDSKNNNIENVVENNDEDENNEEEEIKNDNDDNKENKQPIIMPVVVQPKIIQDITPSKIARKTQKKYRREASEDEMSVNSSISQRQETENIKLFEVYKLENEKLKTERAEFLNYKEKMEQYLQSCNDEIYYLKSIIEQKEYDKNSDNSDNSENVSNDNSETESDDDNLIESSENGDSDSTDSSENSDSGDDSTTSDDSSTSDDSDNESVESDDNENVHDNTESIILDDDFENSDTEKSENLVNIFEDDKDIENAKKIVDERKRKEEKEKIEKIERRKKREAIIEEIERIEKEIRDKREKKRQETSNKKSKNADIEKKINEIISSLSKSSKNKNRK